MHRRTDERTASKAIPSGGAPDAALHAEPIAAALDAREWVIRPAGGREARAHAFLLRSGRGKTRKPDADEMVAPCLVWIPAREARVVRIEAGASGWMLWAAEEFLARAAAHAGESAEVLRAASRAIHLHGERADALFEEIGRSFEAITREGRNPGRGSLSVLTAHLMVVLVHLWRGATQTKEGGGAGSTLIERFHHLVELHFGERWPVERYARALGVTQDRLHGVCVRALGRGPRALIHERLAKEACVRLEQIDAPAEQIGYGLGFHDPGYFNRFFRRHVGMPPGLYRRRMRASRPRTDPSYAAWP